MAQTASARFTRLFQLALDRSRPHLNKLVQSARGSLANALADTNLLTKFAEQIHQRVPFFARLFVPRKAFVKFVLSNRDKLAPLITSAAAQIEAPHD